MVNTYTKKERNLYLLGLLGQNMIYNIIATGMTYYFQSVIFIPAMAISIIMAVARVWDAINDPMMGTIVDRTRTKYGKCRPYLMVVPSIVFVTTMLTFVNGQYSSANPTWKNVLIVGWAAVSYILWGMSYTAGDIPIWGITSLMTE
ncbi:MAG: MFS transporter, partial [Acutalibacteraceae bacterium]